MAMQEGFRQCIYCKKKTLELELNHFGECPREKCTGRTMKKLMQGWKYNWPDSLKDGKRKKKKGRFNTIVKSGRKKKMGGGEEYRSYSNVKKSTALDEAPATIEEEAALMEKV